jgi:hypothetical protein
MHHGILIAPGTLGAVYIVKHCHRVNGCLEGGSRGSGRQDRVLDYYIPQDPAVV